MTLYISKSRLKKINIFFVAALLFVANVKAQSDTLVFNKYNKVVGEIKKMEKGVLEIDVPFGDENFRVKWINIHEICTVSKFVIGIKDKVYRGRIASIGTGKVKIFENDSVYAMANHNEIAYLNQFKDGFSNRFSALVEVGFNLTKAQDLRQFSFRSGIGYKAEKWSADASYGILRSNQNNSDPIRRTDGLLNYRRILLKNWYLMGAIATLSNTEQLIDLRANSQLGFGKFIINTNKAYWGVKTGINNNLERFANESTNRNTWEVFLGSELNLFDVGDLELALGFLGYKGLTDAGRYRADINFDTKYELPLDLFIRLGISLNYDNRPAFNASQTDYIVRSGIGWEW
ncbi:MAG: DUF481 domain-containing protein [Allomuricauda sp.]